MRRVLVSLPSGVWKIINSELKGTFGERDSEVVRNVMIAYLSEKGYLNKKGEKHGKEE
ncbi:CopG family transcriptional regulator [Candidatus Bathyarchaeota archaeon]|jgi:metal-responsive CopG/Arc/MetJ family transcriptional regulator|nr:CopG family transcriptional regulator [Candidatus Bathyarchaeota archaeon]